MKRYAEINNITDKNIKSKLSLWLHDKVKSGWDYGDKPENMSSTEYWLHKYDDLARERHEDDSHIGF